MTLSKLGRLGAGFLLGLSLTACQRNATGGNARITFQVPAEMAQKINSTSSTNTGLFHVVVQATAADIPEKVHVIYSSDEAPLTQELSLEIPSGDNRLIQVLAAYGEAETDKKFIYYGDTTASLRGATTTIDVPIKRLGTGSYDKEADLQGRILESASTGPSGDLQIVYSPPGKPAVLIKTEPVLGGWFSAFIFDEIPLDYILPDGTSLLQQAKASSLQTSPQVLKITFPDHYERNWENGVGNFRQRTGSSTIVGFFAKNSAFLTDKKICVQPTTALNNGTLSMGDAFLTQSQLNPLSLRYFAQGTTPTFANSQVTFAGGTLLSNCGPLDPNEEFKKYLRYTINEANGGQNIFSLQEYSGRQGFFAAQSDSFYSNGKLIKNKTFNKMSAVASGWSLVSNLLPGSESGLDGIIVYRKQASNTPGSFNTDCRPERLQKEGWAPYATRGKEVFNGGKVVLTPQLLTSLNLVGGQEFSYCLSQRGQPIGVSNWLQKFDSAAVDTVEFATQTLYSYVNQCHPVGLQLRKTGWSNWTHNPNVNLTVTVNSRYTTGGTPVSMLYSTDDCSDTAASSKVVTFAPYQDKTNLYYKTSSPYNFDFFITATSPSLVSTSVHSFTVTTPSSSFTSLVLARNIGGSYETELPEVSARSCVPVRLSPLNNGAKALISDTIDISTLALDKATAYTLPSGTRFVDSCVTKNPIANTFVFSGESFKDFAIEVGNTPPEDFLFRLNSSANSIVRYQQVNLTPVVHHLKLSLGTGAVANPLEGSCQAIDIRSYNASGVAQPVPAGKTVLLNMHLSSATSGGTTSVPAYFGNSTDCNSGSNMVSEFQIVSGESLVTIWMKSYGLGLYRLDSSSNNAFISHTASAGNNFSLNLNILMAPLAASNAPPSLANNIPYQFIFEGGAPPYTITSSSGGTASILNSIGPHKTIQIYTPSTGSVMSLTLTDSSGQSLPISINLTGP